MKRALLALLVVAGCSKASGNTSSAASSAQASAPPPAASSAAPAADGEIRFIENDYAGALAKARAEKKPIFIDTWAPWCHTCMSMRAYVFPDPKMRRLANELVWLSIDFENDANAAVLAKFPTGALPTLWVIDSETETASLKWAGSATAAELEPLLADAVDALKRKDSGGEAAAAFLRGMQATGAGKTDDAIVEYRKALSVAPGDWKRRSQVVEALSMGLDEKKRYDDQVALADAELPKLAPGTSLSNVLQNALSAAYSLPKGSAGHARLAAYVAQAERVAADLADPMLADDRSSLYEHIVEALKDDDPKAAKDEARAWAAYLEAEAAKAKTPEARAVFDPHRLSAYMSLGETERAIPMLEASEREMPADYNPPARLARAYFEMKKYDRAAAAADRALARAYGPRKLQIYMLKADIAAARGDKALERATLEEASKQAHASELPGRYAHVRDQIDKRLARK